jgi:hypothetical protein
VAAANLTVTSNPEIFGIAQEIEKLALPCSDDRTSALGASRSSPAGPFHNFASK